MKRRILLAACLLMGCATTSAAPRVIDTFPAANEVVSPGTTELRITFDQAMAPDSYSFVSPGPDALPDMIGAPRLSADGRTYSVNVRLEASRHYGVQVNSSVATNFKNREGTPAVMHVWRFSTRAE